MDIIEIIEESYHWQGLALVGIIVVLLCVQLYYYLFRYGRLPKYRSDHRESILATPPPISIIVPLFNEDTTFVEERLPMLLVQKYHEFEVVIVYVGLDTDFFEDLEMLRCNLPNIVATKIHLDPRFPISRKMALNVGIKSAHYEHMVITTSDSYPTSNSWLKMMGRGFTKANVISGYCGVEPAAGVFGYVMRAQRMMTSLQWLSNSVAGKGHWTALQNMGMTKELYYRVNGFNRLNMNIGENDLFMQEIITPQNSSLVLSPLAIMLSKVWGGWSWWFSQERYYRSAYPFYPMAAQNHAEWEVGSRVLFLLATIVACVVLPLELKIFALLLFLIRELSVLLTIRKVAARLGEKSMAAPFLLYDLVSPWISLALSVSLRFRRESRVWR